MMFTTFRLRTRPAYTAATTRKAASTTTGAGTVRVRS
jgi:hypothetical protein